MQAKSLFAIFSVVLPLIVGCHQPRAYPRGEMFGPATVRIHPTFTRFEDRNNDRNPDGVEAVVELLDQFGEPTRAAGRALFEAYEYRPDFPEPRGKRIGGPWIVSLATREEQEAHWNRAVRAYSFHLDLPNVNRAVIITATFQFGVDESTPVKKGRLFDQLIVRPK